MWTSASWLTRCDNYRSQMIMHIGRRDQHTRPCLLDFGADRGIEFHKPDFTAPHQISSESAALPNSPITSASSPASPIFRAASAHPLRAGLAGARRMRRDRTCGFRNLSPLKFPGCRLRPQVYPTEVAIGQPRHTGDENDRPKAHPDVESRGFPLEYAFRPCRVRRYGCCIPVRRAIRTRGRLRFLRFGRFSAWFLGRNPPFHRAE